MVKRAYDVRAIGSQRFGDRFPGKRRRLDDEDIPRLSEWRCNLVWTTHGDLIRAYALTDCIVKHSQSLLRGL